MFLACSLSKSTFATDQVVDPAVEWRIGTSRRRIVGASCTCFIRFSPGQSVLMKLLSQMWISVGLGLRRRSKWLIVSADTASTRVHGFVGRRGFGVREFVGGIWHVRIRPGQGIFRGQPLYLHPSQPKFLCIENPLWRLSVMTQTCLLSILIRRLTVRARTERNQ